MLFDLEEYVNLGIIGPNSKHPKLINWSEAYNTSRYTRDAYLKTVNDHILAAQAMSTPVEFQALKVKHVAFLDAFVDFGPKYNAFWNAMVSFPLSETEGLTDGVKFDVYEVAKNEQNPNYIEYPATSPTNTWWMDNYRTIAIINPDGPYTFTTLTGEIIAEHKYSFASFMATVKDILVTAEGKPENLTDWVTPEVMPFETYPEVTGYVRGTNSLPIKDAIVRLVDADGVSHEVITDDKGYYKFSNEYVYNNVALTAAGATNSFIDGSFNMFLLDHKNGSTASLYNKTSKFENSFFGAENNRSMTWPVYVKMGRNNRRNFKIEFIPNYSNFPSFSGYVKDAAGNPIKDALVFIKDSNSGYGIGQYRKPNGDDAINYKYNDFGVDRTILTDENGFYEYTSQMVGEWFNKHGFVEYGIPTTILTNPARVNESMNRWMMSNEFVVYLMPYKQDVNSTSMNWGDGTAIYDSNDYVASRFEYALSNVTNQFYWRDIVMGQNNVFNVDVVPAVGNEVMADKIKMTCTPGSRNISGYIESTSGYCKFVFSNGVSEVKSGWFDFSHSNYGYDTTMFSEEFYVYSCDSEGRASGYITKVDLSDTEFSNISNIDFSETENLAKLDIPGLYASDIDLSGLSKLYKLRLSDSKYLETISGLEDSKYLSEVIIFNNQRLTSLPFVNKDWIHSYEFTNLPMVSSLDLSTNGKKSCINGNIQISINGLESLESINLGFVGHTGDYGFYTQLYGCKQLLVDDVDSLLQQFVDSGKRVDLYTDKARSSDSDAAYDTLINRNSNLNFGSEYFESNEVKKSVVMYVDPSFGPDSNNSQKTISLNGNVTTTTGYFRLNAWYDNGYPKNYQIYQGQFNREINVEFDDTFESRPIEIYSTDQYGRPSGSITGIDFNNSYEDFKNIVDIDLTQATELTSLQIKKLGLTSLDLTLNVMLDNLSIIESGKIETIYVGGLVSLNNLNIETMGSITTIDGIETLTGLDYIYISDCPELDFVSLSTLTSLRAIDLFNVFKYDSTHVDTMLSELKLISDDRVSALNTLLANKQSERDVKLAELSAFDAQEPTVFTLDAEKEAMYVELDQLISDGADQSLIDAKQLLIDAKGAEITAKKDNRKVIDDQLVALDSEISDLNSQISNTFSGCEFNTGYMARTSASDADYDSLVTYGWNLQIGSEFFAPYTLPVKGYITLGGNGQIYLNFRSLVTSTGYYTFKDSTGNIYSNSGNSANFYAQTGVLEFWSTDQFGRAGGDFTALGFDNEYVTSVDFDNLTSLTSLSFKYTQITTIDVSNLTNLEWFECEFNSKITSITGLNLLDKLISLRLTECTRLTSVDTSGLESLTRLYLDGNSSLTDIDISVIGSTFSSLTSLTIYNQSFETPKHLDIHANINEINYNYFRTFTSADLDTLLAELDANGQSNGQLAVGYVARTEASDVAFNNLQSKGWNLGIGSYFIGPNEDPTIAYLNFEGTSVNESVSFVVYTHTNYFVIKYPNGSTETRNSGWIYYDFNSDIPASERVFEIYGADQFGRPTDCIYNLGQLNKCSSVDVSALKHLEEIQIEQNERITSLDLDGLVSLVNIFANSCPVLETISIIGCTASKNAININSCPQLDIDAFLIQLDQTGSLPGVNWIGSAGVYADQNTGYGFTPARTSLSDIAAESLESKGFILRVVVPAGKTLEIDVNSSNQYISLYASTSTGYFKVLHNVVNGNSDSQEVIGNSMYTSPENYNSGYQSRNIDYIGKMHIYSCTSDGTPSGEVRYINFYSNVNGGLYINPVQLDKIKFINTDCFNSYSTQTALQSFNYIINNIAIKGIYLSGNSSGWLSGTYDLSNIDLTYVQIDGGNSNFILPDTVIELSISNFSFDTSFISNLPVSLKKLQIYSSNMSNGLELQLPSLPNLENLTINSVKLGTLPQLPKLISLSISGLPADAAFVDYDLTSFTLLRFLQISNCYTISSIDITGLSIDEININALGTGADSSWGTQCELIYGDVIDCVNFYTDNYALPYSLNSNSQLESNIDYNFGNRISVISLTRFSSSICNLNISSTNNNRVRVDISQNFGYGFLNLDLSGIKVNDLNLSRTKLNSINLQDVMFIYLYNISNLQSLTVPNSTAVLNMTNESWKNSDLTNIDFSNATYLMNFNIYGGINSLQSLDFTGCNNIRAIRIYSDYGNGIQSVWSGDRNNISSITGLNNKSMLNLLDVRHSSAMTSFSLNRPVVGDSLQLVLWDLPNLQTINLNNSSSIYSLTLFRLAKITNIDLSTLVNLLGLSCHYNTLLTTLTIGSTDSGFGVSAHDNPVLNSVIFANEPNGLYNLSLYNNPSFTATTVDNILSSLSNNNRFGGYLRMTNLNLRSTTGAPATGYNRIVSKNWNIQNN
jgi:hypothetical protein